MERKLLGGVGIGDPAFTAFRNLARGSLPIDTWSHVACVRTLLGDGSHQYEWYVNHELRDTAVESRALPPTSSTWTISGRGGGCNDFTGLLDEIRMTPKALTPDEFLVPGSGGVGPFLRGDCDANGKVGGSPTEAIVLLVWAFRGATAPPPFPDCDQSTLETDAVLGCEQPFCAD